MEKTKPNTTKAHIHQSKEMYNTQNKHKKTKARFSCLLRHSACKWRGLILGFGASQICHLLTYLDTDPLRATDPHGATILGITSAESATTSISQQYEFANQLRQFSLKP